MRMVWVLIGAMMLVGCEPTGARLPDRAAIAPPLDHMWPENTQQLVWTKNRPSGPWQWEVSVGNNRIWVSEQEKRQAQLRLPSGDLDAWRHQIDMWRSQRLHQMSWSYASSTQPLSSAQRSHALPPLWVFVAPDCQLCDQWRQRWPQHIPAIWIPVSKTSEIAPLWFTQWCNPTSSSDVREDVCRRHLQEQYVMLQSMGLDTAPVIVAMDGRALAGWPDALWLSQWWNPSYKHWLAPDVVQEPDM